MTRVDLLSDTTYCEQAVKQLDQLLGDSNRFPVERAQIYGLRQIARQQPGKVEVFANHQRERTRRKLENASERARPNLEAERDFWTLVSGLCDGDSALAWSVRKEGHTHLPVELQNIPARRQGMTHEEQRHRNELNRRQRKWLVQWTNEHIPAFFERFCTHALYRIGIAKNS